MVVMDSSTQPEPSCVVRWLLRHGADGLPISCFSMMGSRYNLLTRCCAIHVHLYYTGDPGGCSSQCSSAAVHVEPKPGPVI